MPPISRSVPWIRRLRDGVLSFRCSSMPPDLSRSVPWIRRLRDGVLFISMKNPLCPTHAGPACCAPRVRTYTDPSRRSPTTTDEEEDTVHARVHHRRHPQRRLFRARRAPARRLWWRRCSHTPGSSVRPGSVTKGTSVCDFEPQEKEHQHSLYPAVASFERGSRHVNLVDTPGYPDFLGRALPVLARRWRPWRSSWTRNRGSRWSPGAMMEAAGQRGLARMIVVNKIDIDEIDLEIAAREPRRCVRRRVPAHQPPGAGRRARRRLLLLRAGGRADRPSRRWTKPIPGSSTRFVEVDEGAHGALPRRRGAGGGQAPRCVRESVARGPSHTGVLRVGGDRCGEIAELAEVIEKGHAQPRSRRTRPSFRNAAGEPVEIGPDPGGARPVAPCLQGLESTPSWASSECSGSIGAR